MEVAKYRSLLKRYKDQPAEETFAHFHPEKDPLTKTLDFDAPFKKIAAKTLEGAEAWDFTQDRFKRGSSACPKLKNYLLYTFIRLRDLEVSEPDKYFVGSADQQWACFNTGLQDRHSADLYAIFQRYQPMANHDPAKPVPDWVYRGTVTSRESVYRDHFGMSLPALAWYSTDSRDYIFNTDYRIDTDIFDHMFDRAKERSGFAEAATDESVHNYLRGAIENLIPKIKRNYKTAIPMYFIEEKRMQDNVGYFSHF
jgi:Domain of unknown function (DUF3825)